MGVATIGEASMQAVTTIGLDIAKSVFQVHGIEATGNVVIRRRLKRRHVLAFFQKLPPCVVGIEACATSHHWSRELKALGHTVRLMPPAYVKPYVKRQTRLGAASSTHPQPLLRDSPERWPIAVPDAFRRSSTVLAGERCQHDRTLEAEQRTSPKTQLVSVDQNDHNGILH